MFGCSMLNLQSKEETGPLAIKWVFLNVTQEWCNIHLNVIQSDFTTFRMTTNLYWYELGHMVASPLIWEVLSFFLNYFLSWSIFAKTKKNNNPWLSRQPHTEYLFHFGTQSLISGKFSFHLRDENSSICCQWHTAQVASGKARLH